MENKFTGKAQNILNLAVSHAQELGSTYVGSEHILLGLLEERDSVASRMLYKRGIVYGKIKSDISENSIPSTKTHLNLNNLTPRAKKIVENSYKLSSKHGQNMIGSEHLLYSLLNENDCPAVKILEENGLYVQEMQTDILAFIQLSQKSNKQTESKRKDEKPSPLESFSKDLIFLAKQGKIDPTLCREKETERMVQILSRRTKNNPCLIGEPGVGKTAVVEGLASRIADGNVPPMLKNKTIYALDIPSLIAGAKYRGEFEDRMKNVMQECKINPNIILFIDEIHTIIGAGSAEGAIDAANILKPALARGEIQIIGATTLAEYRKHIEKDSALERRFQPIRVAEPTIEETEKILLGLRSRYENHHGLKISNEAISGAVDLSVRYINDRFLPDKAIDLIDEAASRVKIKGYSSPSLLETKQNELNNILLEKENALILSDFEKIKDLKIKQTTLEKSIERLRKKASHSPPLTVEYNDVAKVVTDWTGIPVDKLLEAEGNKLLSLEKQLKQRIIGQDEAIKLISGAIRRGRIGLKSPEQPTGSFIFIGPTGVGKTELCIALSEILLGTKNALLRFDMSEYMEKHSISKLIGAPPGYVGYGEGGLLTEKVRRNPYCLILFDEIEKAHPEIFNLLLQILEDGTLTDSQGHKVSFKNSLIVMTSNLGSINSSKENSLGFFNSNDKKSQAKEREKNIKKALERTFKPEFLGRIDEVVIFNSLSKESLEEISLLMLATLSNRIERLGIELEFDQSIVSKIALEAYEDGSGARKIRHTIRRLIENPLSIKMIAGEFEKNDSILAILEDENIVFKKLTTINCKKRENKTNLSNV